MPWRNWVCFFVKFIHQGAFIKQLGLKYDLSKKTVLKKFLRFGGCKPTFVKPCPPKRQGNVASTWLKLSQPPKFSQRKKIIEENNFALNVERVVKLKARFYFIF